MRSAAALRLGTIIAQIRSAPVKVTNRHAQTRQLSEFTEF